MAQDIRGITTRRPVVIGIHRQHIIVSETTDVNVKEIRRESKSKSKSKSKSNSHPFVAIRLQIESCLELFPKSIHSSCKLGKENGGVESSTNFVKCSIDHHHGSFRLCYCHLFTIDPIFNRSSWSEKDCEFSSEAIKRAIL